MERIITIRRARPTEKDKIFAIMKKASEWRKSLGDFSWDFNVESWVEWLKNGIAEKMYYFVCADNEIIGVYRLQYKDTEYWGEQDKDAAYLHSFAIDRNYKGKGLGYIVMNLIEKQLKKEGVKHFRLDAAADNEKLCKYYETYGFKFMGYTKPLKGNTYVGKLYEKKI